ncbi:MAG: L-threonylcarbamoyladenylate synthase [Candidatus Anstonellales archaeon]
MVVVSFLKEPRRAVLQAARAVLTGKLIVYPTDTLYGIGCDATNTEAVRRVYEVKRRDRQAPLSVMMADIKMIEDYCIVDDKQMQYLRKYLPGPYTLILKCRTGREIPASANRKLGVRIPKHAFCELLLKHCRVPVVTTSANISKRNPPASFNDIEKSIIESVSVAIDSGPCEYGKPSTIIDLVEGRVIR